LQPAIVRKPRCVKRLHRAIARLARRRPTVRKLAITLLDLDVRAVRKSARGDTVSLAIRSPSGDQSGATGTLEAPTVRRYGFGIIDQTKGQPTRVALLVPDGVARVDFSFSAGASGLPPATAPVASNIAVLELPTTPDLHVTRTVWRDPAGTPTNTTGSQPFDMATGTFGSTQATSSARPPTDAPPSGGYAPVDSEEWAKKKNQTSKVVAQATTTMTTTRSTAVMPCLRFTSSSRSPRMLRSQGDVRRALGGRPISSSYLALSQLRTAARERTHAASTATTTATAPMLRLLSPAT
jgi:hypothetical protein